MEFFVMLSPLLNRKYRYLFAAQAFALTGTGLLTIALGLLAFELAGAQAGVVLGMALTIKMVAYVFIAPSISGFADCLPHRRTLLVGLDVMRAGIALLLPFVNQTWQIYCLIFVLQAASAASIPTVQAIISEILPNQEEYTKALILSRLTYELEGLLSPVLAAGALSVINFHWLFAGTALGLIGSALLVFATTLPVAKPVGQNIGILARMGWGVTLYFSKPRLRGFLPLNLVAAAGSAFVIVNTVVEVREVLDLTNTHVAWAFTSFGGGIGLCCVAFTAPS